MNIEEVKVEDITPYWRNPRDNTDTVPALKKSIQRYGFQVPLVLDKHGTIITGHTRFRALRELGWEKIPCVYVDIDDTKARELRLIDNRVHEITTWDDLKLDEELASINFFDDAMSFFDGTLDGAFGLYDDDMGVDINIDEHLLDSEKTDEEVLVICPVCMEMTKVNV